MKTLKEIKRDCLAEWAIENKKNNPLGCYEFMEQFYRQAINEILEEVVGNNKQTADFRGTHTPVIEAGCMKIGYNQAKAEIKERIAKIIK